MNAILKVVQQKIKFRCEFQIVSLKKYSFIAAKYDIYQAPSCLLFINGQVLWKGKGLLSAKSIVDSFNDLKVLKAP